MRAKNLQSNGRQLLIEDHVCSDCQLLDLCEADSAVEVLLVLVGDWQWLD
ncbi:hypothetical protein ACFFU8_18200 [Chromobacterium piscinae]|nr:hypothetical protein [Chromobacterium piscinae]MCD5326751.1 hypothetical protein [Chromobacterium piscinae]